MIKYFFLLLGLVLLFCSCEGQRQDEWFYISKTQIGDNPSWKNKDFDDSEWTKGIDVHPDSIFWLRIAADFEKKNDTRKNQGILVGGTGSYEVWLDGIYLGKNGELATAERKELPGKYNTFFIIPDSLSVGGEHVFAFRMTTQFENISHHNYIILGDYFDLVRAPLQSSKYMFLFGGVFLITAIYFLFLFFSRPKEISPLIFSIICLIFCGLITMEYLKLFYQYLYPFQRTRLEVIGYFHISLAVAVPFFFMIQFNFPFKKIVLGLIAAIILVLAFNYYDYYDWVAFTYNQIMWIFSFFITGFAVYQKKKGATIVFSGVTTGFFFVHVLPYIYQDSSLFISDFDVSQFIAFIIIVLTMLYIMTLNQREERLAYEASLVLSERLKNELLKKNIKPHFIMNTLTSLIDWVEEAPKEGVKFITALAGEFEILNEIADYKLVPIEQEIKLCKNHLKVMGYRKEITYKWEEWDIDMNEIIPPAIIHTAVENGVTHSIPNEEGVIIFRLSFERNEKSKKYILHTIAEKRKESAIGNTNKRGGTGLKYIRSRLQESYPDKWAISSQATRHGWETVFEIFA